MFPEVIHIGGFFLPTYGLLVAGAFLTALWITGRLALQSRLDQEAVLNLGIYCALAGIVGAKLLMIVLDPAIRDNWHEIFSLSTLQAAGIFYGGFLAALAMAVFYMRRRYLPVLKTMDVFAPGLAVGHAIGRLGCFSAGCCWGLPTRLPWAVTFTSQRAKELVGVPLGEPLHPTQLYESLGELIIFAALYFLFLRPHREGSIIILYFVLYGTLRFLVEFVRFHDPQSNPLSGPFSTEQWISLALLAVGLG
jgi:phosphatidylglycerol:prolipoprotein diacylglycerol transferase